MISFKGAHYPKEVILYAVFFYVRYGVSYRDHVRDTRMNEDASRIRKNPCIFGLLRSFALNLMRFNKIENISLALYDNALSLDRVLDYQGI